jgi:hypothetical protein
MKIYDLLHLLAGFQVKLSSIFDFPPSKILHFIFPFDNPHSNTAESVVKVSLTSFFAFKTLTKINFKGLRVCFTSGFEFSSTWQGAAMVARENAH